MLKISTGKKPEPIKGLLYGVPGIGKTTFASKWPAPLFIDVESGSTRLDVARVDPTPATYSEFLAVINQIRQDNCGYKTIVIDSADWLEQMMIKQICQNDGVNCIEKYQKGYGKGWTKVCELWAELLDNLDRIRKTKGMHILFVAHSKIKRHEPADDTAYDRYTLVQNEKSADILKKWADLILFAKYDVTVSENSEGKIKAHSNGKRLMMTDHNPCWDAKNRFDLPLKLDFDFSKIEHIFAMTAAPSTEPASAPVAQTPASKPAPVTKPAAAPAPAPLHKYSGNDAQLPAAEEDKEKADLLLQIDRLIQTSGVGYADVAHQLEKRGIVPAGTEIRNYNNATLNRIITGWNAIEHNIKMQKKG